VSIRAALLALAALAAPGFASGQAIAQERDLGAMLGVARSCLAQIGALRGSDSFAQRDMAGLVRKLASDIDYAETWSRHDPSVAVRYLSSAMDCDGAIAAWADRSSRTGTPLRRTKTARGDLHWSPEQSAPDLSFLITGRARRGQSFSQYGGPELAAWDYPYSR
jgi:hypothetical protein